MNVNNKHIIILYLSAAPQHAVADNSEMFFEAGEGYDKSHRCGINNPNSSDITREKKSGGSIMPYESSDTSPDIHNRFSSKPDWQKQLLLKIVSSIQAIGLYAALCSTHETC